MITIITIASFIALFIRSTDEDRPLRKIFAVYASKLSANSFLYKATVECLECRCLWLSIISLMPCAYYDVKYLFFIPLTWVLSNWFYKIIVG
jgi:hypothetical protein